MTKPRFTPDPLPEGVDPTLASFLQRQFDRINDWWPKDLEDRVKALEKSFPYIGGTWPIVDYSTVEFNGSATAQVLSVANFMVVEGIYGGFYRLRDNYADLANSTPTYNNPAGSSNRIRFTASDGNGTVVLGSTGGTYWQSTDGINWTQITTPFTNTATMIDYCGDEWVVVVAANPTDNDIWVSSDLVNWTKNGTISSGGLVPGATDGVSTIVVATNVLQFQVTDVWVSFDKGKTWTSQALPLSEQRRGAEWVEYAGGAFFVLAKSRSLYRSETGAVWSLVYTGKPNDNTEYMTSLKYGDGKYIAFSSSPSWIHKSTDGVNWTSESIGVVVGNDCLIFDETEKWLAGSGTGLARSYDGDSWSIVTGSASSITRIYDLKVTA